MKPKDIFFYILGGLIVAGFFITLIIMIVLKADQATINLLLGALIGAFMTVKDYFFGSSKGSAEKNELINKAP